MNQQLSYLYTAEGRATIQSGGVSCHHADLTTLHRGYRWESCQISLAAAVFGLAMRMMIACPDITSGELLPILLYKRNHKIKTA
jgi:hypothetical protein